MNLSCPILIWWPIYVFLFLCSILMFSLFMSAHASVIELASPPPPPPPPPLYLAFTIYPSTSHMKLWAYITIRLQLIALIILQPIHQVRHCLLYTQALRIQSWGHISLFVCCWSPSPSYYHFLKSGTISSAQALHIRNCDHITLFICGDPSPSYYHFLKLP